MSKHTKGPWYVKDGTTLIVSDDPVAGTVAIAYVYPQKTRNTAETQHHLRLIKTAPDMYDLLAKLVKTDRDNDLQRREKLLDELGQMLFSIDQG